MNKRLAALTAALILAAPLAANAEDVPSYAAPVAADRQIQGRIANFDGGYNLQVTDANGYVDNVQLHDGTIINPTGLTLAPGMIVGIDGFNLGRVFDANEIDKPYNVDAGVPIYAGHPWNYYGSGISLDFFFGSGNWWHGGGIGRGYAYAPRVRVDDTVRIDDTTRVRNVRQNVNVQTEPPTSFAPRPSGFTTGPSGGYASHATAVSHRSGGPNRNRR